MEDHRGWRAVWRGEERRGGRISRNGGAKRGRGKERSKELHSLKATRFSDRTVRILGAGAAEAPSTGLVAVGRTDGDEPWAKRVVGRRGEIAFQLERELACFTCGRR